MYDAWTSTTRRFDRHKPGPAAFRVCLSTSSKFPEVNVITQLARSAGRVPLKLALADAGEGAFFDVRVVDLLDTICQR